MSIDLINGMFELSGGFFVALHARQVFIDREVKGVSIPATVFMTLWGFWNLIYYPVLNQWISFVAGTTIVIANAVWVFGMIKYRDKS